MTEPLNLTPEQALGVALSVAAPTMVMGDAQAAAPDMLAHLNAMGYTVAALATPTPRWCARYFGSDGTLCSTHNRRFADDAATRCARALEYETLAALAATREEMPLTGPLTTEEEAEDVALTAEPLTAEEEAELRADIAEGPEGRAVQIYGEDVLRLLATLTATRAAPAPDTRQCAKCGADDIAVRWDGDHYDCLYKQARRSDWPREGGEHLHHQCRTCGWSWATAVATREELP